MLLHNNTSVKETDESMEWFIWDGTSTKKRLFAITLKHGEFDIFENTFCQVISEWNLMCNSYIQLLMLGPHVTYVTKYVSRENREPESKDFEYTTKRMENAYQKKGNDYSEGKHWAITSLFIHNSGQVVRSLIAKYLTWEKQDFEF